MKKRTTKLLGLPVLGTLTSIITLIAITFALMFVVIFVDLFFIAFFEIFSDNKIVLLIALAIPLLILSLIGGYFAGYLNSYFVAKNIYRQAKPIWFYILTVPICLINLVLIISSVSIFIESNFFLNQPILNLIEEILELESDLGFGILSILTTTMRESVTDLSYVNFILLQFCVFFLASLLFEIKDFSFQACHDCKFAYIFNPDGTMIGDSYLEAKFKKTEGYYTQEFAEVHSNHDSATIRYNQYHPGTTEFKGVYKHTAKTDSYECPFCKRRKHKSWTDTRKVI